MRHLPSQLSGYEFSKWLNNEHATQEEFKWIKEVSSKAIKQSIMNGDTAFKRFFKKTFSFPKYKKRSDYGSFLPDWNDSRKAASNSTPNIGKDKAERKRLYSF